MCTSPGAGATSERGDARDGICPRRLHTRGCARVAHADHGAGASTRPGSSVRPFVRWIARHPPPPPLRPAPRRPPPPRPPPPRRRSRSGTRWRWVHGARVRGAGVCRLESGFVLLCDRATPGETVVARVTGVKGGGRFAKPPRSGPRSRRRRRGVPVPALRGMRRVHVAGRIVRRAAGHEARAGAGRVAPNRKGFRRETSFGGTFVGAMEKGRERALPARRVRARRPRPADAPRAVHGEVQGTRWSSLSRRVPPRKRRERSRRAPRPAPAGRPRHRRRGHLPRRRRPGCLLQHPVANAVLRKCTGAPADAREARPRRSRRSTDGRARAC